MPRTPSTLISACAGSGKTKDLVDKGISKAISGRNVAIITYTDSNVNNINERIRRKRLFSSKVLDVFPWYTFLLKHFIKPYYLSGYPVCRGIQMEKRDFFKVGKANPNYYFDHNNKIYKDYLADFASMTMHAYGSQILKRLHEIYDCFLFDEAQDFTSQDFDLFQKMIDDNMQLSFWGDPRQMTYKTSDKGKKKSVPSIYEYAAQHSKDFIIDAVSLNRSYRCPDVIIKYASKLFPQYNISTGKTSDAKMYFVTTKNVNNFLETNSMCQILHWKKDKKDCASFPDHFIRNFGDVKGSEFSSILIIPTEKMKMAFLSDDLSIIDSPEAKAKTYVALTRSEGNIGILVDEKDLTKNINSNFILF